MLSGPWSPLPAALLSWEEDLQQSWTFSPSPPALALWKQWYPAMLEAPFYRLKLLDFPLIPVVSEHELTHIPMAGKVSDSGYSFLPVKFPSKNINEFITDCKTSVYAN